MKRFTMDIDERFDKNLTELANGGSKVEVIRRALATYQYLKREVGDGDTGKMVSITTPDGAIEKNVILP